MTPFPVRFSITFEHGGERYEFYHLMGKLRPELDKIYQMWSTTTDAPEINRLTFCRALLLGEVEGCKVVDLQFQKGEISR